MAIWGTSYSQQSGMLQENFGDFFDYYKEEIECIKEVKITEFT
jgi:hypothetical protein